MRVTDDLGVLPLPPQSRMQQPLPVPCAHSWCCWRRPPFERNDFITRTPRFRPAGQPFRPHCQMDATQAQEIWKHMSGMPVRKEDAFVCEICSHVLCNPLVLSCGHRFCNSCVDIAAGFFSLHQCPSCSETCVLSEEYMRVYSISNHVKGILLLAGAPAAARGAASAPVTAWSSDLSSGPGPEGAEVGGAGLLGDGLPRNKSASALSRAWHLPAGLSTRRTFG